MEVRCQIRTSATDVRSVRWGASPFATAPALRFHTDSKTLTDRRSSPDSASVGIGLERAFIEEPPDAKALEPEGR